MTERFVLAIDDHPIALMAMRILLSQLDPEIELLEAGSVQEALDLGPKRYRFILLDMKLPGRSHLDALRDVLEAFGTSPVIVVSADEDPVLIRTAIDLGAAGYLPKSSKPAVMLEAMRLVLVAGIYLPPIALRAAPEKVTEPNAEDLLAQLTERERAVMTLALRGWANKLIARELDIAEGTVKAHLSKAYRLLDVHNRTEALYAVMRGYSGRR